MNVSATDRAAGSHINNSVYASGTETSVAARNQDDIAIRFGMPWLRIHVNSPILPILTLKLVAMATSIKHLEK